MTTSNAKEILSSPYSAAFNPPSYPNRTFKTQILPTNLNSLIQFSESDARSSEASSSSEPFRSLSLKISDPTTHSSLLLAASSLRQNNLVAFPTETVYGLGGSALSIHSTTSIFKAKKRPMDNPLIVHVSDLNMLDSILPSKADFDYEKHQVLNLLIQKFWPGPMTLLFPVAKVGEGEVEVSKNDEEDPEVRHSIPSTVTCGLSTVAIRMPKNPLARSLISLSGVPIAAPSANASGRPSPTESKHVFKDLGGELDRKLDSKSAPDSKDQDEDRGRIQYILEGGNCNVGVESTVIDCITNSGEVRVLRPGGLSVEEIQEVLENEGLLLEDDEEDQDKEGKVRIKIFGKDKDSQLEKDQMKNPTTPGMKYRHYAPDSKVIMLVNQQDPISDENQRGEIKTGEIITSLPTILRDEILSLLIGTQSDNPSSGQRKKNGSKTLNGIGEQKKKKVVKIGLMCREDSKILSFFDSKVQPDKTKSSVQSTSNDNLRTNGNINHLLRPMVFSLSDILPQDHDQRQNSNPSLLQENPNLLVEIHPFSLGQLFNPEQSAQRIFSGLRTLDEGPLISFQNQDQDSALVNGGKGCDLIMVEGQDDEGMGLAVMNRLRKAASQVFNVRI